MTLAEWARLQSEARQRLARRLEIQAWLREYFPARIFGILTTRETQVLELRFGLPDGPLRSLEATVKLLGSRPPVSRERVRQIEARALRKMRDAGLPI